MKVLVAFEESQVETTVFREAGIEAYSCDLKMSSGKYPEYHIQADAYEVIEYGNWDIVIAHPPCTYLTSASAVRLLNKNHEIIDEERYKKGLEAREKFLWLCHRINVPHSIENPAPLSIFNLPAYSQVVQPYEFGEPVSKRTCLWNYGLPNLKPTEIVKPEYSHVAKYSGSKMRSTSFKGIAIAMLNQWLI